jgi:hypothetical protein
MLRLVIMVLFLCFCDKAKSQHNTRIQAWVGIYNSPDQDDLHENYDYLFNCYGASLQHKFHSDWSAKISYNTWYFFNMYGFGDPSGPRIYSTVTEDIGPIHTWKKGDIEQRIGYQFIDAKLGYTLNLKKNKELFLAAGGTYAYGQDRVIIGVFGFPGYPDLLIEGTEVYRRYWGATWEIGYDYLMLKNRINAGASINARYIFRQFSEYTLQINLGYNFNQPFGKKKKER